MWNLQFWELQQRTNEVLEISIINQNWQLLCYASIQQELHYSKTVSRLEIFKDKLSVNHSPSLLLWSLVDPNRPSPKYLSVNFIIWFRDLVTVIMQFQLMLLLSIFPKVITLSSFHFCICKLKCWFLFRYFMTIQLILLFRFMLQTITKVIIFRLKIKFHFFVQMREKMFCFNWQRDRATNK